MTQHIHITGCSPRSGTTLMSELLHHCFEIDAFSEHEEYYQKVDLKGAKIYCSKQPDQMPFMPWALKLNPNFWCIYMIRDPRDVVSSKHQQYPEHYFVDFKPWLVNNRIYQSLKTHPRFVTVYYEALVEGPDKVQQTLQQQIPFLKATKPFSAFNEQASVSADSAKALGGARPVSRASIGNWKNHTTRIAEQLEKYPQLQDCLVEHGYEKNDQWLATLDGISPQDFGNHMSIKYNPETDRSINGKAFRRALKYRLKNLW